MKVYLVIDYQKKKKKETYVALGRERERVE